MPFSHLPALLTSAFLHLARWLQRRSTPRLVRLLGGLFFARGRRTATSWFRAAGIARDYRPTYAPVCAAGRRAARMATTTLLAVAPLPGRGRLRVAIDDTPTPRYGPRVEGCGTHHNPSRGPAGSRRVYGHVRVTLAGLARHPDWGTIALPLQAQLYVRRADLHKLPRERRRPFRTKLQMAVEQLAWLRGWVGQRFAQHWVVADGAYAKRPFLRGARRHGFTVAGRLRKDAALLTLPLPKPPGRRGRQATYGKGGSAWPSGPGRSAAGGRCAAGSTARRWSGRSRRSWRRGAPPAG